MFGVNCVHHNCTRLDASLPCDKDGCVLDGTQCVIDPCHKIIPPTNSEECASECEFVEGGNM
jgi:hypothetical protein